MSRRSTYDEKYDSQGYFAPGDVLDDSALGTETTSNEVTDTSPGASNKIGSQNSITQYLTAGNPQQTVVKRRGGTTKPSDRNGGSNGGNSGAGGGSGNCPCADEKKKQTQNGTDIGAKAQQAGTSGATSGGTSSTGGGSSSSSSSSTGSATTSGSGECECEHDDSVVNPSNETVKNKGVIVPNANKKSSKKKIIIIDIPAKSELKCAKPFDGKDIGEIHYIVKNNLAEAYSDLKKYLNDEKAENIVLSTHAGGGGYLLSNNTDKTINGNNVGTMFMDLANFQNPSTQSMKNDVAALKAILRSVKNGGNVVFLGCFLARGKEGILFSKAMHSVNNKVNTYTSQAFNAGAVGCDNEKSKGSYYNYFNQDMDAIFDWNLEVQWGDRKYYNKPGLGFIKFPANSSNMIDLGKDGKHDGNLTISGNGNIKEKLKK